MRLGQSWSDVVVRDMSSRGMLLTSENPPPPGAYLEICGPATTLVARTIWVRDQRFGVRTQDRIDIDSVLTGGRLRPQDPPAIQPRPAPRVAAPDQLHHESRHRASSLEFIAAIVAILIAAVTTAFLLQGVFVAPMRVISAALGGS